MTPEQATLLKQFAQEHGRNWKSELSAQRLSGRLEGPLRALFNAVGPTGIAKLAKRLELNSAIK